MTNLSIENLESKYNLELQKILKQIKSNKARFVLLQFAEGIKPYATTIVDYLREQTQNKVEFLIWFGSCYGACDTPVLPKNIEDKIDLLIQFGHNAMMPSY